MPGIEHIPSAAFGYPDKPEIRPLAVMSHIMQGYQSTMIQWAKERPPQTQKSAHFTISRSGRIVQHVAIDQAAWTAGYVNTPVTWKLYPRWDNPNKHLVQIEHEGFSVPPGYGYDYIYSPSRPWPEAMVQASIRVHLWVFRELGLVPSEDTVIGHFMTDGKNRVNDPGDQWPRQRTITELRDALMPPPAPPAPAREPVPISPELDLVEGYLLLTDAFHPSYNSEKEVRIRRLPMLGGKRRYLLEVEDK